MSETLRCPFCGGEADIRQADNGKWHISTLRCGNGDISHHAHVIAGTKAEAIAAWNTRAADKPETFHDEFYDCESTVDKAEPQGADGNFDQAQVEWLRCMPDGWDGTPPEVPSEHTEQDTREKLEEDWAEFYTTHERECLYQSDVGQFVFDLLDRQAAIAEREGREAWHKAASGEIYQARQEADELRRQVSELRELNDSLHARIEEAKEALL